MPILQHDTLNPKVISIDNMGHGELSGEYKYNANLQENNNGLLKIENAIINPRGKLESAGGIMFMGMLDNSSTRMFPINTINNYTPVNIVDRIGTDGFIYFDIWVNDIAYNVMKPLIIDGIPLSLKTIFLPGQTIKYDSDKNIAVFVNGIDKPQELIIRNVGTGDIIIREYSSVTKYEPLIAPPPTSQWGKYNLVLTYPYPDDINTGICGLTTIDGTNACTLTAVKPTGVTTPFLFKKDQVFKIQGRDERNPTIVAFKWVQITADNPDSASAICIDQNNRAILNGQTILLWQWSAWNSLDALEPYPSKVEFRDAHITFTQGTYIQQSAGDSRIYYFRTDLTADSGLSAQVSQSTLSGITELVSTNFGLIFITDLSIHLLEVSSPGSSTSSINLKPVYGNYKCAPIKPQMLEGNPHFILSDKVTVAALHYSNESNNYSPVSYSEKNPKIFEPKIKSFISLENPHRRLYIQLEDNSIIIMTSFSQSGINGFTRLVKNFRFIAIEKLIYDGGDQLHTIIKRNGIDENGNPVVRSYYGVQKNYISADEYDNSNGIFLDGAVFINNGVPIRSSDTRLIGGDQLYMPHYANEYVDAVIDGRKDTVKVDSNGYVNFRHQTGLPYFPENAIVGEKYIYNIETLNIGYVGDYSNSIADEMRIDFSKVGYYRGMPINDNRYILKDKDNADVSKLSYEYDNAYNILYEIKDINDDRKGLTFSLMGDSGYGFTLTSLDIFVGDNAPF